MILDAVVLAGGRSSRLGGIDKTSLRLDGRSLLSRAVDAVSVARRIVVVGCAPADPRYVLVREDPPFGGPAAALAAGVASLGDAREGATLPHAHGVLVLAGDMPSATPAVRELTRSAWPADTDGLLAVDGNGRRQYLAALFLLAPLREALGGQDLTNASMRSALADLRLADTPVPDGSTRDVDTPADVADLGLLHPDALAKDTR